MFVKHSTYQKAKNTIVNLKNKIMTMEIEKNNMDSLNKHLHSQFAIIKKENDTLKSEKEISTSYIASLKLREQTLMKEHCLNSEANRKLSEENKALLVKYNQLNNLYLQLQVSQSEIVEQNEKMTMANSMNVTEVMTTAMDKINEFNNQNLFQKLNRDRKRKQRKDIQKFKSKVSNLLNL